MKRKGYKVFADILNDYGVSHIFYQDAIFRKGLREADERYGIVSIMTHSEGAAGCMADGYARVTGRPGVCMAQSIGSANLLGGIQDAWLANSPLVAITGKKPPLYQYRNSYQEAPHGLMYESITKFNTEVTDTGSQFEYLMRQCFKESITGKPRPTHIDVIGRDAIETDFANIESDNITHQSIKLSPSYRISADAEVVKRAADELKKATKPVIVAGRGALVSNAGNILAALAKKCDIPIITTLDGKTLIDESSEYWMGIVGNYGMNCANQIVSRSDLVLFVGTQTSDQVTIDWKVPIPSTRVIQIDIAPEELGRNYPNLLGLCGDAKTVLEQIFDCIEDNNHEEWMKEASDWLKDTINKQDSMGNTEDSNGLIHPVKLYKELQCTLPENGILVSDTGYTAIWSATIPRLKSTQSYYRAAGSLGWSFPASLGVKCGAPNRPVVCITGDGGLFYHLSEMETQIRYNIPTVTVVDNNHILSACIPQTEAIYNDNIMKGIEKIGFSSFSYANIAKEFGMHAVSVDKAENIAPAINEALSLNVPSLIDVQTLPIKHLPPMW